MGQSLLLENHLEASTEYKMEFRKWENLNLMFSDIMIPTRISIIPFISLLPINSERFLTESFKVTRLQDQCLWLIMSSKYKAGK